MCGLEVLCGVRRLTGFGHVGLGGSFGWAIPAAGLAFAMVHNRLLTP
jgi:CubicO group peptidase (beta-lactamase class C family)